MECYWKLGTRSENKSKMLIPQFQMKLILRLHSRNFTIIISDVLQDYVYSAMEQWKNSSLDAVICPIYPVPAPELHYDKEMICEPFSIFLIDP